MSSGRGVAAAALLLLLAAGCRPRPSRPGDEAAEAREWTLLYYMAYDNDLDRLYEPIVSELSAEPAPRGVAVAVLADRLPGDGLVRTVVTSAGVEEAVLDEEDSAEVGTLAAFLDWARTALPSRRYALMVLGHGGRLDRICVDWRPSHEATALPEWMSVLALGDVLRRWGAELDGGRLELLFLQSCGRASVEDLSSLSGVAPFVLASETLLGAPNTYYRPMLRRLAASPSIDGEALGLAILDADEHTASAVLLDGEALGEIPARATALVEALVPDGERGRLARPAAQSPCFAYGGDRLYDLCSYLRVLAQVNGGRRAREVDSALEWFEEELIIAHRGRSFPLRPANPTWCGLSLHVPESPERLERYGSLPIFRRSDWARLAESLEPGGATAGAEASQGPPSTE